MVQEALRYAESVGLHINKDEDLTPLLRQFHTAILEPLKLILRLPLLFSFFENFSGGTVLQHCIQKGWV